MAGVPGIFFYKNFARQYAAILGIEESLYPAGSGRDLRRPKMRRRAPQICVPNRLVQATNRRQIPDIPMGWSVVGLGGSVARMFGNLRVVETGPAGASRCRRRGSANSAGRQR